MSEIDLLIEELEDIENNPIKPFVAIRIREYLRNYKYHESRIAELKAFINQLIEAGKGLLDSLCTDPEEEKTVEVMNWKAVVDKVNKEREK